MESHKSDALNTIESLIADNQLASENVDSAMKHLGATSDDSDVLGFLHSGLRWVASVFIGVSIIFFVAANWQAFNQTVKFALIQTPLIASIIVYVVFKKDMVKKGALLVSFLTIGASFALFGQTYQTGADPWQLFFNWALLSLPLVLISQTSVLYVLWAVVANVALATYADLWLKSEYSILYNILLNTLFLAAWEWKTKHSRWISNRWPVVLLTGYLTYLFVLGFCYGLWWGESIAKLNLVISVIGAGCCYYYYRYRQTHILVLVFLGIGSIVCANAFFIKIFEKGFDTGLFLLCFFLTIGMGYLIAKHLKKIAGETKQLEATDE